MDFEDGVTFNNNNKSKKTQKFILIAIVLVFIAIIAIICTIIYIQSKAFRVYINGVSYNLPEDMIITNDSSGKIYVDIKGIASYLGYDSHNGEYKVFSEDTNKCYVESENETASFFLNSNKISKMPPNNLYDYEDYTIDAPVISKDNKLYCTIEGIKIGFNVVFNYNANSIEIYTLPYLVSSYDKTLKQYGYSGVSKNFNNQKAILYNLFVIEKSNKLYGVINSKNEEIIGSRYTWMEFNENAKEFYVKNSSDKVGIVTLDGVTKINLLYDEISMISNDLGLYIVKSNNKYGVLGNSGNIVIHLEYDQIGINAEVFKGNNIKNRYILLENLIPVSQNKKWGLFDVNGKQIIPLEWDLIGYSEGSKGTLSGQAVNNVLIVPKYKGIVLGKIVDKDNKYAIYDNQGSQIIPCALDNVYFITNAGLDTYYMEYQGQTLNVEEYIENLYEQQGKNKPTDTIDENNENT